MIGQIELLYSLFRESKGVSTDTRTIEPGMLFFGLRGDTFDGSSLAQEAMNRGASAAIIDNADFDCEGAFLVDDGLLALQDLARYHRAKRDLPVLGITGTNGKTTTKELINSVMSVEHTVTATTGNYNNHIGVPLTILSADLNDDLWIVEMGTNQPGDIAFLAEIAQPTHGLITNIGIAHLERLGSQHGIYAEKSELYNSVVTSGGYIFINKDDPFLNQYSHSYKKALHYSANRCSFGKLNICESPNVNLELKLDDGEGGVDISTHLVGEYNMANISAALTVGEHFGCDLRLAAAAVSSYRPDNMRSQHITTQYNHIVLDGYNANPTSMRASIDAMLSQSTSHNVVLILGDMLELGDTSQMYHREVYEWVRSAGVDAHFIGNEFSHAVQKDSCVYDDVHSFLSFVSSEPLRDKMILIKGSRGMRLEQLLAHL